MSKRRKVAVEVKQDVSPYVCYFPTGNPVSSGRDGSDGLTFDVYENASSRSSNSMLVGTKGSVSYVGQSSGVDYSGPQPCTYAVGVYDKSSGKLQLMPLQGGKIMRLEVRLPSLQYNASGSTGDAEAAETREGRLADNKRLVDSFGSTRRRRQLTSREDGVVRVEKLSGTDALTGIMRQQAADAEAQGLTKEKVLKKASEVRTLPPHHPEATRPLEAYVLEEFLTSGVAHLDVGRLLSASEDAEALDKLRERGAFPAYVLSRVNPLLRDCGDKALAKRRARALGLLAGLLRLVSARPELRADPARGGVEQLAKGLRLRQPLVEELLDVFYVHSRDDNGVDRYERPQAKMELLYAYVLVTALLAEVDANGDVTLAAPQFEALRGELKMEAHDLVARLREVGATVGQASLRAEGDDGTEVSRRSFSAGLLKQPNKTLGECFPGIKIMKRAKK